MAKSLEETLKASLDAIAAELSGTIGISVVELATGMSVASLSKRAGFDLGVAAAYNAEVVKQKQKAVTALKLKSELEEFVITFSDQIHVIRFLSKSYILYYAGEATSNMGLVRTVIKNNTEEMTSLLK
jgi:sulfur carrier protein ThiS